MESQSLAGVLDNLVEVFPVAVNEVVEIQTDVGETVTEAADSVETVEEIQTDVGETVEEIQTDAVETVTEAVDLVATETVAMTDVTLDEIVQAVNATMSVQMSVIGKLAGSGQAMPTIEGLNPFVLDVIKTKIETIEVKRRDSRSPLLGCARST